MIAQYVGNDVFKGINFNLYPFEDINYSETKENLLEGFRKEFEKDLTESLDKIGLKYKGLKWFSPSQYNYQGDSIDLRAELTNKKKLITTILENHYQIDRKLAENKSYDGYIALTIDDCYQEIAALLDGKRDVDTIVLRELLSTTIDFKQRFVVEDYFVYEPEDEDY